MGTLQEELSPPGRRTAAHRLPISDKNYLADIGIINADVYLAKSIMDLDPAVKEDLFVYEAHPGRSTMVCMPQF